MPVAKRIRKIKRQRRTPEAVRNAALQTARDLLVRSGPESITLPAVAKWLGMTHGNITHHFGSVGALHAALVDQIAQELAGAVNIAVAELRNEQSNTRTVVDALFQAFSKNGAGQLIAWLAAKGDMEALEPLFATISLAVRELSQGTPRRGEERELSMRQNALVLMTTALGNALIGDRLHLAVDLAAGTLNALSAQDIVRRAYPADNPVVRP